MTPPLARPMQKSSYVPATLALLLIAVAAAAPASAQPADCRVADPAQLGGAYRSPDGRVMSILPAGPAGQWRITHFDSGRSHRLHPTAERSFRSAADLDSELPAAFGYQFELDSSGAARALKITPRGGPPLLATKLRPREVTTVFRSGDTELFGKLTLPAAGAGPFKTVVHVHGSDPVPSVDREWLPHLLAAHGIATFVFDKRGTGCSRGQYVQHFGVLSGDVLAAVSWLKTRAEVDGRRIGLAGFSQGGWVAPLAALKERSIAFVAVGYGLAMSMADEDRLEAPTKLREAGVDAAGVAEFEQLNAALHQVARDGFKDWGEFERQLERLQGRPWFALARAQQSWLGVVMQMGVAQAKMAAPGMFEHFFQPFYEPVPTLEQLGVPMLWLIAAQDIEAPPGPTIEALQTLRRQGKPYTTVVFANADHGLQEFELREGQRVRTKYADGYFATLLKWIRQQR